MTTGKQMKFKHWLEYLFFQSFFLIVKLMPLSWSAWFGKLIAFFGFKILKARRLLTMENIRNARERGYLPADTNDYHLAKQVWEHMGYTSAEYLYYCTQTPERIRKSVQIVGAENLQRVLDKKKGAVVVMAHIGNWELLGMALCSLGYGLSPIVKTQSNQVLDEIIQKQRRDIGMKVIPKLSFLRPIIEAFRRNEMVPFLIDQADSNNGVVIDVFGRKTDIPRGPAEFALKTNTPVIFAYMVRKSPAKHLLYVTEELNLIKTGDYQQDLCENTALFFKLIEDAIRKHPAQWFSWMHKLWPTEIEC